MAVVRSKTDDRSEAHLRWLVENRSRNQHVTLNLFLLLKEHRGAISENITYTAAAQEIVGIVFSLWRAVFLADLSQDDDEAALDDASGFLGTLISHNAINYPQDRMMRDWAFPYYLRNARMRLTELARQAPVLVLPEEIDIMAHDAKDDWIKTHDVLEAAITRLRDLLTPKP